MHKKDLVKLTNKGLLHRILLLLPCHVGTFGPLEGIFTTAEMAKFTWDTMGRFNVEV